MSFPINDKRCIRLIFTLVFFFVLLFTFILVLRRSQENRNKIAKGITLAHNHRVYCKDVTISAFKLLKEHDAISLKGEQEHFEMVVRDWKKSHLIFLDSVQHCMNDIKEPGKAAFHPQKLDSLYKIIVKASENIQKRISARIDSTTFEHRVIEPDIGIVYQSTEAYVATIELVTTLLSEEVNLRSKWLTNSGIVLIIATFVTVLLIFIPAMRALVKQSNALDKYASEIAEKNKNAEILAAQANEAVTLKEDFLANMTHEVRTPLNGMLGIIGILFSCEPNKEQLELLNILQDSSRRLKVLIDDLLDFSAIKTQTLDMESIDFDVRNMFNSCSTLTYTRAKQKGLLSSCSVDKEVPRLVRSDPGRIKQIVTNIVSNAIKFTEVGTVRLSCSLQEELAHGYILKFSVADTGIGIPKERHKELFEDFTQLDGSRTRKYGGTGVGLSISKQLIELLHGDIWVKSEEGHGTTVSFTIPVEKAKSLPYSGAKLDMSRYKILLVTDNETSHKVTSKLFEYWNVPYLFVSDLAQVIPVLNKELENNTPFDLVLFDMDSAKEFVRKLGQAIKSDKKFSALNLIVQTASAKRGDTDKFYKSGFSAFLTEPLSKADFRSCISQLMTPARGILPEIGEKAQIVTRHSIREARKSGTSIGIVEKDTALSMALNAMLEMIGYKATLFDKLEQAKAELNNIHFDLLFLDLDIEDKKELESFLESSSKKPENVDILFFGMTGKSDIHSRGMLRKGISEIFHKPLEVNELRDLLRKHSL